MLSKKSFISMPWKNGKGQTEQIAIGPEGAVFPNDFSWRISSATVNNDDPFSNFPGCDRFLVVTEGAGLSLNGKELHPLKVLHFSGEELIDAKLLEGPVVDLGVIFRRNVISASMKILNLSDVSQLELGYGTYFVFCIRGKLQLDELEIHAGDSLRIDKTASLKLDGLNHSVYALIAINQK
ncbi:HutD family protein [Bdellovibrio sp. HCB290]|uniref:HutD/Ves family protein n=1 Tax=Bdellovibrio sp. HCB290 TaxID=3394356 RepID=UPI0039B53F3C